MTQETLVVFFIDFLAFPFKALTWLTLQRKLLVYLTNYIIRCKIRCLNYMMLLHRLCIQSFDNVVDHKLP